MRSVTESRRLESGTKRFPRALTQGWVVDRVVHLEQVLRKPRMQFRQRPGGESAWINGFRHLSDVPCDLRVPLQVVDESGCLWFQRGARNTIRIAPSPAASSS